MNRWQNMLSKSILVFVAVLFVWGNVQAVMAKQVEITVWKFGGAPKETEMWPVKTKEFEEQNPDIKVKYNYFYGQIRVQKILGAFKSKKLPDVIVAFGQDIPDFVGLGIIQPLDDIDAKMTEGWKANIVPGVFETGMYQGKLYALPTYVDMAPFLAVNLDDLEAAGLDSPPKTWSELREYAKKMTRPDRPGITMQATLAPVDINIFEGIAYANGGRFLDEETETIMINTPGFVDALQLYADLVKDGSTPPNLAEMIFKDGASLFAENKCAMWVGMSWLIRPWYPTDPEGLRWISAPFPKPDKATGKYEPAATIMDPTAALMIPSTSKKPEAALRYIDFWAQQEQLNLWDGSVIVSRVPASKEAYKAKSLKELWPQWVEAYEKGELFKGSLPMPRFNGRAECEQYLGKAIQEVVLGQKDPQTALDDAAKKAQELYDLLNK